jgi:hypothetical protein
LQQSIGVRAHHHEIRPPRRTLLHNHCGRIALQQQAFNRCPRRVIRYDAGRRLRNSILTASRL